MNAHPPLPPTLARRLDRLQRTALIAGLWLFTERWDRVVAQLPRRKEPAA